ncbi:MarR family transcriptional regulator [Candidatus Uhrbacteria bacterium]|nr:MarR family transcriptional regulator [Candidatus Uhrbacteria bacterium]
MTKEELLGTLGLSREESSAYLALLEHGPANVSDISRRTKLHRPAVYQVLPNLVEKGLVSLVPHGKQKWFAAEPPDKLSGLLETARTEFEKVLPDLERAFAVNAKKPVVKSLDGIQGMRFVYEDLLRTLKRGDTFYRYSAQHEFAEGERYLPPQYRERRDAKGLQRFVITSSSVMKKKKPRLERAIKVVPPKYGLFDFGITQLVYGDKLAFIDYNTDTATIIENPVIAKFQATLFKILFDQLT